MTSQATSPGHTCACGCGTPINPGSRWARGHFHRGEGTWRPVPGPGETLDDLGGLGDEFPPDLIADDRLGYDELGAVYGSRSVHDGQGDELGGLGDELVDDPAPASLRGDRQPSGRGPAAPVKVTAALKRDIHAKLSIPLELAGQFWKARDPVCGGMFVEQRPAVADALTSIVCQSADLIDFFTGPAGGFMVYLNLGAALLPVVELVLTWHIFGHGHQADHGGPGVRADTADELRTRYAA